MKSNELVEILWIKLLYPPKKENCDSKRVRRLKACARKWWPILGEAEGSKIRSTKKGLVGKEWIQNSDIIHVFSPIGIVEKLTKPTRKSNEENPYLDHRAFEFLRFEHYKLFQQNIKNYWAMLRPEIEIYIFSLYWLSIYSKIEMLNLARFKKKG